MANHACSGRDLLEVMLCASTSFSYVLLLNENIASRSESIASTRKVRLWTDEYSNLFQILQ